LPPPPSAEVDSTKGTGDSGGRGNDRSCYPRASYSAGELQNHLA
jgi:hypothetical protein